MANNNNIIKSQLITFTITLITIILHDLHLICSFIITYPLYFSYVIYFTPYVIKLISFISPLFIVTVILSILITTTTTTFSDNLNQLKLGIVKFVVQVMKWNLDCGIGDGDECDGDFEEFEIYKIVFDCEFFIMICDQSDDQLGFEKLLECSVYGDRRNNLADSDSDSDLKKFDVEKIREISAHGGRKSDVASCDADVDKLGSVHGCWKDDVASSDLEENKSAVEKSPETLVHGCRKSDVASCDADVDKLGSVHGSRKDDVASSDSEEKKSGVKSPETLVHDCRESDVAISDSDVDKLSSVHGSRKDDVASSDSEEKKSGVKSPETLVHGYRKSDVAISDSDVDKLSSVHGCRINDVATNNSFYVGRKNVATCNSDMNKIGIEKLIEELDKFDDFTPVKKVGNGSETINSIDHEKLSENLFTSSSTTSNSPSVVSSYGSMREDNEWRKTLACKLFEERHNSLGGEEGMDSLWEAQENNNSNNRNKNNTRSISFNTSDIDIDTDTDTDTDEMAMSNGHLCCLQALKLSTGKMNLGMGKPNIVKIRKAFKGFGWLNYVKKKNGKKS